MLWPVTAKLGFSRMIEQYLNARHEPGYTVNPGCHGGQHGDTTPIGWDPPKLLSVAMLKHLISQIPSSMEVVAWEVDLIEALCLQFLCECEGETFVVPMSLSGE